MSAPPDFACASTSVSPVGAGLAALEPAAISWVWLLGREPRTRVRVQQSGISFLTYLTGGLVAAWGTAIGVIPRELFLPWAITLTIACFLFFFLARSRFGLRLHDATFTEIQILWGFVAINWAYAMCGAWRSSALLPLVMAINFGALTLNGRRLTRITILAIASLAVTITLMHLGGPPRPEDLWLDLSNLAFVMAITPCAALLAARFGAFRLQLKSQRLQLQDALARIEEIATLDPLTGLANRRHTEAAMATEMARLLRGGPPFTIALIDLDRFKFVNDTYGHGRGDFVLRRFAELANAELRQGDLLGRWGGEEFLLLAPNTDAEGMHWLLGRIRASLSAASYEGLPEQYRVKASVGLATVIVGESIDRLLERADEALYRAKRLGRDRVEEAEGPPEYS